MPKLANNAAAVRRCSICGCTESDCQRCIERTGEPCAWVEGVADLCTACLAVDDTFECFVEVKWSTQNGGVHNAKTFRTRGKCQTRASSTCSSMWAARRAAAKLFNCGEGRIRVLLLPEDSEHAWEGLRIAQRIKEGGGA